MIGGFSTMERKAFSLLTAINGLELSESLLKSELYDYSRRLFAILKPQPGQDHSGDEETADQMTRVFGKTRSIQELNLEQVEPALFFSIRPFSEE